MDRTRGGLRLLRTRRGLLRTTLLAGGLLLAGCLGGAPTRGGDDTETDTDSPTPTPDGGGLGGDGGDGDDGAGGTRPRGTGGPGVTLVDVDDPPALPIRPAVEISREAATTDHPPQLQVTLTNESDDAVSVGEGRAVFFQYVLDDSGALMLLPAAGEYPAEADCWRLTDGIAVTEEYRTLDFDPGESRTRAVDLYGAAGGDGCLPVGEHRFETRLSVASGPGAMASEGESATWGFTILLE